MVRTKGNSFIWGNLTDRCGELKWLENTLEMAEQNNEKVLILQHYPPNDRFASSGIFIEFIR